MSMSHCLSAAPAGRGSAGASAADLQDVVSNSASAIAMDEELQISSTDVVRSQSWPVTAFFYWPANVI